MKIKILTIALIAFAFTQISAQKDVFFTVKHKLGVADFAFNTSATNDLGKTFDISRIDYYMSGFVIIHDGGQTINVPKDVIILAKGSNNVVKNLGNYDVTNVEGISFSIGVPAIYNNTDPTLYVAPNPLAPQSPSMHWGWSAGFRFLALEGMAGNALNINYQMHGLWNDNYFSQTHTLAGVTSGNKIYINLDADYTQAVKGIDVSTGPIDHGVNATDLTVLKNFRDLVFTPGAGFPTASKDIKNEISFVVFPNPSKGNIQIKLGENSENITDISIMDIYGRTVKQASLNGTNHIEISALTTGMYFVNLNENKVIRISKPLIVE